MDFMMGATWREEGDDEEDDALEESC